MVADVKRAKFKYKFDRPRIQRERATGIAKANEHIALIEGFYEVHGGSPDHNLAHQFIDSLAEPVDGEHALAAYNEITSPWLDRWLEEHPDRAKEDTHLFHRDVVFGPFGFPISDGSKDHRTDEQRIEDMRLYNQANIQAGHCLGCGGPITEDGECI